MDETAGPQVVVLAAADPAQPYGATLPWPRGEGDDRLPLQRAAGAYVVLVGGEAALYVERGGRGLLTLPAAADDPEMAAAAVRALPRLLLPAGPLRELNLERVDRVPPAESALAGELREIGFRPAYRGWIDACRDGNEMSRRNLASTR